MADLHKAEADLRVMCDRHPDHYSHQYWQDKVEELLAALDAARGEAVAWRWPRCEWVDGKPKTHDLAAMQGAKVTPEFAYAAPPAAAVPEGYALVPVEPTEAMLNAARDWSLKKYGQAVGNDGARGCYAAMLAAANKENNNG